MERWISDVFLLDSNRPQSNKNNYFLNKPWTKQWSSWLCCFTFNYRIIKLIYKNNRNALIKLLMPLMCPYSLCACVCVRKKDREGWRGRTCPGSVLPPTHTVGTDWPVRHKQTTVSLPSLSFSFKCLLVLMHVFSFSVKFVTKTTIC